MNWRDLLVYYLVPLRFLGTFFVLFLFIGLWYFFGYSFFDSSLAEYELEKKALLERKELLLKQLPKENLQHELEKQEALLARMPSGEMLSKKVVEVSGLQLIKKKMISKESYKQFLIVLIRYEVAGSFEDLVRFFSTKALVCTSCILTKKDDSLSCIFTLSFLQGPS